jgi:AraC-like DNA-binding protein
MARKHTGLAEGVLHDTITIALCGLFDFVENVQFWIKDRAGRYGRVNRGFLLNYSLETQDQVVGKTDYDLSPRHLADQFRQDDALVLNGEAVVNRIETVGRFDHTTGWCVTNKIALRDAKGRVVGTAGLTCPLNGKNEQQNWPTIALGKAITFVREHYAEPLTVRALAAIAHLSVRAFERQFQQNFHSSPLQYVKRLRVRMACHALVYTNQPLAKIATDHGFCDQSHFTREFHRQTYLTPGQYRARYRTPKED